MEQSSIAVEEIFVNIACHAYYPGTGDVTLRGRPSAGRLKDYLLLPEEFGVSEDMRLELSLENNWQQISHLPENIGLMSDIKQLC